MEIAGRVLTSQLGVSACGKIRLALCSLRKYWHVMAAEDQLRGSGQFGGRFTLNGVSVVMI